MKQMAIVLALGCALSAIALADEPGGIAGTVVDAKTKAPIAHATLYYYRNPWLDNGPNHLMRMETNAHGFFSDITLQPGRYVIMSTIPGKVEGCAVDDVMGGEVAHMKIEMGHNEIMCSGPRVHPAMVDPNAVGDIYRI